MECPFVAYTLLNFLVVARMFEVSIATYASSIASTMFKIGLISVGKGQARDKAYGVSHHTKVGKETKKALLRLITCTVFPNCSYESISCLLT